MLQRVTPKFQQHDRIKVFFVLSQSQCRQRWAWQEGKSEMEKGDLGSFQVPLSPPGAQVLLLQHSGMDWDSMEGHTGGYYGNGNISSTHIHWQSWTHPTPREAGAQKGKSQDTVKTPQDKYFPGAGTKTEKSWCVPYTSQWMHFNVYLLPFLISWRTFFSHGYKLPSNLQSLKHDLVLSISFPFFPATKYWKVGENHYCIPPPSIAPSQL